MDFRNPGFLEDERAEMLFGVDAGDAPGDERPDHQFQTPAAQNHNRVGINEYQLVWRQCPFAVMFRVVLQNEVRESGDGKPPNPMRVNEFDVHRWRRNQFDRTGKRLVGQGMQFLFYGS